MTFKLRCSCGQKVSVPDEARGKTGKCPKCGAGLRLEEANAETESALAVPQAAPAPAPDLAQRKRRREEAQKRSAGKGTGWAALLLSLASIPAFVFLLLRPPLTPLPFALAGIGLILAIVSLVQRERKLPGAATLAFALVAPLAGIAGNGVATGFKIMDLVRKARPVRAHLDGLVKSKTRITSTEDAEGYRYGPLPTTDTKGCACYAVPIDYPSGGLFSFIEGQDGTVYFMDTKGTAPSAWPGPDEFRRWRPWPEKSP